MHGYNFISIDWDSVRLLQAGQFVQETRALEERVRWTLHRSGLHGISYLEDVGIPAPYPEGEGRAMASVAGLYGIAEHGGLIEIPSDAPVKMPVEANGPALPLFVGVHRTQKNSTKDLQGVLNTHLLQCAGLRPEYKLAADNLDPEYDWLEAAQFTRTETDGRLQFVPHEEFVPECLFLKSHSRLWEKAAQIQQTAKDIIASLKPAALSPKQMENGTNRLAIALSLLASLGPAACPLNPQQNPRDYVTQLGGVLTVQLSQIMLLLVDMAKHNEAEKQIVSTLELLGKPMWNPGEALTEIQKSLQCLSALYPPMLDKCPVGEPPRPKDNLPHKTVETVEPKQDGEGPKKNIWRPKP